MTLSSMGKGAVSAIIILCHTTTGETLAASPWAHATFPPGTASPSSRRRHFHPQAVHCISSFAPTPTRSLSARASHRLRRTRTVPAAIMAPKEGGIDGSVGKLASLDGEGPPRAATSSPLPNWRVVDPRDGDRGGGVARSPFCHPLPQSDRAAATAVAAPWSESAFRSALSLHERMEGCADPELAPAIQSALHDLEMAYRLYGPHCMVGSYNGGKDAVVIFHLMRAVHARYCGEMRGRDVGFAMPRPRVVYFQHRDEFPEVTSLLDKTVGEFDVDMLAFAEGISFGEGLKYLVERNVAPGKDGLSFYGKGGTSEGDRPPLPPPHPLAFVLGTRKGDPNAGSQGVYAPSSHYMPPFLRVNPILDWTYGHVWRFLRLFDLPYCSLYDDGYTSLGTVKDTLPCPALKRDGEAGKGGYLPAYMLEDWSQERAGRVDKKKSKAAQEGEEVGGGRSEVTMSQTSSTASLPAAAKKGPAGQVAETVSAAADVDDVADVQLERKLSSSGMPTVGLIVIGDELLKGMTPDSNIISAARALRSNNVPLERVSIISDDGGSIADEVRRFSKEVDVIVTSGGVGPTHDDVTVKSIAEALGLDMQIHCEMAELLLEKMGPHDAGDIGREDDEEDRRKSLSRRMSVGQRKMATLPKSSVLQYLADDTKEWPVLQCRNIFILPGVPAYFEKNINQLAAYLPKAQSALWKRGGHLEEQMGPSVDREEERDRAPGGVRPPTPAPRSDTYRVVLSLDEEAILSALNAAVAAHPHVSFGSYPIVDHPECRTIVTLEGRFYNGGYDAGSRRSSEGSAAEEGDGSSKSSEDAGPMRALFFSKEEMDRNVENALGDLKAMLPNGGILFIDSCDDLRIKK